MDNYNVFAEGGFTCENGDKVEVKILSLTSAQGTPAQLQFVKEGAVTLITEGKLLLDKLHNTRAVLRVYTSEKSLLDEFFYKFSQVQSIIKVEITLNGSHLYGGILDTQGLEYYDTPNYGYIIELPFGDFTPLKRLKAKRFGKFVSTSDIVDKVFYQLSPRSVMHSLLPRAFDQDLRSFQFEKRIAGEDPSIYDLLEIVCEAMIGSLRQQHGSFRILQIPIGLYSRIEGADDGQTPAIFYERINSAVYDISVSTGEGFNRFEYKLIGSEPSTTTLSGEYVDGTRLHYKPKCGLKAPVTQEEYERANWGARYPGRISDHDRTEQGYYDRAGDDMVNDFDTVEGEVVPVATPSSQKQFIVGNVHIPDYGEDFKLEVINPYGSDVRYSGVAMRSDRHAKWVPAILIGNGADIMRYSGTGAGVIATFNLVSFSGANITVTLDGGTAILADDVQEICDLIPENSIENNVPKLLIEVQIFATTTDGQGATYWLQKISHTTSGQVMVWRQQETAPQQGLWLEMGDIFSENLMATLTFPTPPKGAKIVTVRMTGEWTTGYPQGMPEGAMDKLIDLALPEIYKEIAHNYGVMRYISSVTIEQGEPTTYRDRQATLKFGGESTFDESIEWETRIGTSQGTGSYIFQDDNTILSSYLPEYVTSYNEIYKDVATHEAFMLYSLSSMYYNRFKVLEFDVLDNGYTPGYFKFIDDELYFAERCEWDVQSGCATIRGRNFHDNEGDPRQLMSECKEASEAMKAGVFMGGNDVETGATVVIGGDKVIVPRKRTKDGHAYFERK